MSPADPLLHCSPDLNGSNGAGENSRRPTSWNTDNPKAESSCNGNPTEACAGHPGMLCPSLPVCLEGEEMSQLGELMALLDLVILLIMQYNIGRNVKRQENLKNRNLDNRK